MAYLDKLAETHEEVGIEKIGTTAEGRDIKVVKISTGSIKKKPAILIDAGLSPREWIGPAQALYIIQKLVLDPLNRYLIEDVDWYIIPLVNPDGYEYSHTVVSFFIIICKPVSNFVSFSKDYGRKIGRRTPKVKVPT